ncbi:MAG: hypothetical protein CL677_05190 [Bdellovibrionaceae bacterium]|nr:hypothetical protein [Pseudobdellovibrionaceae bacterium]|tara:strand:- start:76280 stop:77533 length:1254 start_codon:yes stop_codon:yes gene_type:complete
MNIGIIGLGYVGIVNAIALASKNHQVFGVDTNTNRIEALQLGKLPISEPGLKDLFDTKTQANLHFSNEITSFSENVEGYIVCVGTPPMENGDVNLKDILEVVDALKNTPQKTKQFILFRSTIPPGTIEQLILPRIALGSNQYEVGFFPEFLREGNAVADFLSPSLSVLGSDSGVLQEMVTNLLPPETEIVDIKLAEMIKYANNSFHALKVTFANEMGRLANCFGVSGDKLMQLFVKDQTLNLSAKYFKPGAPFGGTCLTKELTALRNFSKKFEINANLLDSIMESNESLIIDYSRLIESFHLKSWGFIGVTFKPNTDDVRQSSTVAIMNRLPADTQFYVFDRIANLNTEHCPLPQLNPASSLKKLDTYCEGIVLGSQKLSEQEMTELLSFEGPIVNLGFFSYPELATSHSNFHSLIY